MGSERLSDSKVKHKQCPSCKSRDVRGQPSPVWFKRYHSYGCGSCNYRWTEGHRGYTKGFYNDTR